jgi:hypothetical protein
MKINLSTLEFNFSDEEKIEFSNLMKTFNDAIAVVETMDRGHGKALCRLIGESDDEDLEDLITKKILEALAL